MRTVKRIMQLLQASTAQKANSQRRHLFGGVMSQDYLRRREMVKNFWIVAAMVMLMMPLLHLVVAISLFTTFVSFMYLDEAPVLIEEWYDRR